MTNSAAARGLLKLACSCPTVQCTSRIDIDHLVWSSMDCEPASSSDLPGPPSELSLLCTSECGDIDSDSCSMSPSSSGSEKNDCQSSSNSESDDLVCSSNSESEGHVFEWLRKWWRAWFFERIKRKRRWWWSSTSWYKYNSPNSTRATFWRVIDQRIRQSSAYLSVPVKAWIKQRRNRRAFTAL